MAQLTIHYTSLTGGRIDRDKLISTIQGMPMTLDVEDMPDELSALYLETYAKEIQGFKYASGTYDMKFDRDTLLFGNLHQLGYEVSQDLIIQPSFRYWFARVPGSTTEVRIVLFGKDITGFGDYPMSMRIETDTAGVSDGVFLSQHGAFHQGPEGEVIVTRSKDREMEEYEGKMLLTTCGMLRIWGDAEQAFIPKSIRETTAPVGFEIHDGYFHKTIDSDAAYEIGYEQGLIVEDRADAERVAYLVDHLTSIA